jgi:hypothetical protein
LLETSNKAYTKTLGLIMKKKINYLTILLFVFVFSCKRVNNESWIESKQKSIDSIKFRDLEAKYKIYSIGHADMHAEFKNTDTTVVIGKNIYSALQEGYLLFNNDTILLEEEMYLEDTYITEDEENIFIFYEFQDFDSGGSRALGIDKKTLKINWEQFTGGFNLAKPITYGDIVYLSSHSQISKLSLKTGKFLWKLDNLYKQYGMNYVEKILFKDSLNLYIYREKFPSKGYDTLYVNDKTGKLTNPNTVYN